MGTVEQLKTEPPTEQTASRDAIGALADRILADVTDEIDQAQRALTELKTVAISNTADVKAQLAALVSTGAELKKELRHLEAAIHAMRADQARAVDRGGAT